MVDSRQTERQKNSAHPTKKDRKPPLRPDTAPGDVPPIAEEYTTVGVDKEYWKHPHSLDDIS